MIFGDDALYYQIIRDARDPDPAIAWRHLPFRRQPAQVPQEFPTAPIAVAVGKNRLGGGLRALIQRARPQPFAGGAVSCAPACC